MASGPPAGSGGRTSRRPHPPSWRLAILVCAALPLGGCVVQLRLAEVEDPDQATSTITYTGVRDQARRFPDYGSIDATILSGATGENP